MATMTQSPVSTLGTVLPKSLEFPFFADVMMIVNTTTGGFQIAFTAPETTITTYISKTAPWQSPEIERKLLAQLHEALDDDRKLDKGVLKGKLHELLTIIGEQSGTNPETKRALSSPVAQKAIDATEEVIITPGESPIYSIGINGKIIRFTSDDLNGSPRKLNAAWLGIFYTDKLDAKKKDFDEIVNHWLEIAVKPSDTVEPFTDNDQCLEKFRLLLPSLQTSEIKSTLIDGKNIWLEVKDGRNEAAWVSAELIDDFLNEQGKDPVQKGLFKQELYRSGIALKAESITQRFNKSINGIRRCWPIHPDYVMGEDNIIQKNEGPV